MTWWTEDGHITLPKAVIALLAEAAMRLREEIVQEIYDKNPDLPPDSGFLTPQEMPHEGKFSATDRIHPRAGGQPTEDPAMS
ncbi:MAG: hypothetical protein WBC80_12135 [Isosphaeraceae bacterium]